MSCDAFGANLLYYRIMHQRCWICGTGQRMATREQPANLLYYRADVQAFECEECTRALAHTPTRSAPQEPGC